MFKFLLYKSGQFLVWILPGGISLFLAKKISHVLYKVNKEDREAIEDNLHKITPKEADIDKLARKVFENMAVYLYEFFSLKRLMKDKFIKENIVIENKEALDEVLAVGGGGIILSAHLGNWEMGGALIGKLDYPLTIVALSHREASVNEFFNKQRALSGNKIIQTQNAIRSCMKAFKDNELVALLADRDFAGNGIVVKFLGEQVRLPIGPALFFLKHNVPLVPTFLTREEGNRFTLRFEDPIWPTEQYDEPSEAKLKKVMKSYIPLLEKKIKEHPEQWLMFRDFTAA